MSPEGPARRSVFLFVTYLVLFAGAQSAALSAGAAQAGKPSTEARARLSRLYQELKLKREAAEQDALAVKLSALPNRDEDVPQKLAKETLTDRQSPETVK